MILGRITPNSIEFLLNQKSKPDIDKPRSSNWLWNIMTRSLKCIRLLSGSQFGYLAGTLDSLLNREITTWINSLQITEMDGQVDQRCPCEFGSWTGRRIRDRDMYLNRSRAKWCGPASIGLLVRPMSTPRKGHRRWDLSTKGWILATKP